MEKSQTRSSIPQLIWFLLRSESSPVFQSPFQAAPTGDERACYLCRILPITEHDAKVRTRAEDFPQRVCDSIILTAVFQFNRTYRESPATVSRGFKCNNIKSEIRSEEHTSE